MGVVTFLMICRTRIGLTIGSLFMGSYTSLLPYIMAQAKFESDNFKSRVWKQNLNPFGMKYPKQRKTLAIRPDWNNYAVYRCSISAIRDLRLWFEYFDFPNKVSSPYEYAKELKNRGYFESDLLDYANGIERYIITKTA